MNVARWVLCLTLLCCAASCSTLEGTFGAMKPDYTKLPEEDLRVVALEIERAIANGQREDFTTSSATVSVDSPEILQAIRSRAARFELVSGFLDTGFAWEKLDGLLWIMRSKDYAKENDRRNKDRHAMLINGENANRWVIYEEIRKLNEWPPGSLGAVQRIFHDARVQTMSTGQLYEDESGEPAAVR